MNGDSSLGRAADRLTIAADLARVADAREWVGRIGRAAGLSDARVFDLQVVTSEAVANGIEHAASEVEVVAWTLPDRLLVEVTNDGVFQPGLYKDDEHRRRGLGLPVMVSLADHVHVSRLPGGKTKVSLTFFTAARPAAPLPMKPRVRIKRSLVRFGTVGPLLLLPIPVLLLAIGILTVVHPEDLVDDSVRLMTAFNALFISAACFIVAYLAARTFLAGGSCAQLTLGSGGIMLALGYLIGGPLATDMNVSVTIQDTLIMIAGVLFVVTAAIVLLRRRLNERRGGPAWVVTAYGLTAGCVLAWSLLARVNALPVFYNDGYTALSAGVLGVGDICFFASAVLFALVYHRRPSRFALLLGASFALFAVAYGALMVTDATPGTSISWAIRSAQWLAGVYLLAGALNVDYGGAWLLPLEHTLRESEERYDSLVALSPDAVWVHCAGKFVAANPAAAAFLGFASPGDLVGHDIEEFFSAESRAEQRERVAEVYSGGISPSSDEQFVRAGGSLVHATVFRTRVEHRGRLAVQTVARDTSERMRAAEALRASEERLSLALAAARLGTWDSDLVTGIDTWNDEHYRILGYQAGQVVPSYEHFLCRVHPDDRNRADAAFKRALRSGVGFHRDIRVLWPTGTVRWVEIQGAIERDGDGRPVRSFGVASDITDRKLAEQETAELAEVLRQGKELLTEVFNSMSDEVWVAGSDGVYTMLNRAAVRNTGLVVTDRPTIDDVLSRLEVLHPDLTPFKREEAPCQRAFAGEVVRDLEQLVRDPHTGELRYRLADAAPVRDSAGTIVAAVCVVRDVTERKQAEEALRESEERLSLALAAGRLATWDYEFATGKTAWNDEHYRMLGFEPGSVEAAYATFAAALHADDRERMIDSLANDRENGWHHNYEFRIVRPDGAVRWIAMQGAMDRDEVGRAVRSYGVMADITERKQAEEALRQSERRLQALADENERLYRQQLNIAEYLQLALLNIPSALGPVRLGHLYRSATATARVGGDFYDAFEVKDGKIAVLIGDVSGHGIEAARTATLVKDVVHAFIHQSLRTGEVLRRTNALLVEKELPGFVTLFLGILDPHSGVLRYSSAGHPETLLRRATGEVLALGEGSTPLGVYADGSWKAGEASVNVGDLLLLYTDGVVEARNGGEFFGSKRLEQLLKRKRISAESLPHLVLDRVLVFSDGVLSDDVALLALSLSPGHSN